VLFAMGAVAGEAQRGTLELWLARPLSRRRILTERFVAGALALVVPVFASTATVPLVVPYVHEEIELAPLLLCAAHQSLFLLAVYAATFVYSCVSARPMQIAFVMLLVAIFEFALYMVEELTHFSLFRLSDLEVFLRIHATHALDPRLALPLAAFVVVAFVAAQLAFARRVP
jgi:ABC-type transport system involved in multi-copper enzyme maturation permease subunit